MRTTIPHSRPFVGKEEQAAAGRVIASGQLAQGPEVAGLEHELSRYAGRRYGVAVSSGTAALYCSLRALDVKRGDAVVIPSYVCTALLNAVYLAGATPLLADVDPATGNLDVDNVKKALRAKTKAVIVAHLFGHPARADEIERLGVPVIEDCAQCVGATVNGKRAGSLTTMSVFSFYATKVLAAGEGGLVATSDRRIAQRILDLREYDNRDDYVPRFNFKMSDIHAAIASVQVKKIAAIVRGRRAIARVYRAQLCEALADDQLPPQNPGLDSMYYRFVLRLRQSPLATVAAMRKKGIACGRPVFKPLHRYLGLSGFPGSEEIYKQALSIPIYPGLTSTQIRRIADTLRSVLV
jgi:perosamine synthetase